MLNLLLWQIRANSQITQLGDTGRINNIIKAILRNSVTWGKFLPPFHAASQNSFANYYMKNIPNIMLDILHCLKYIILSDVSGLERTVVFRC